MLQTLRDALIGKRERWKVEGRRCVEFQQNHQAQSVVPETVHGPDTALESATASGRAASQRMRTWSY